jgi:hypothetical protein
MEIKRIEMKKTQRYIIIVLTNLFCFSALAQEQLRPLSSNQALPEIKHTLYLNASKTASVISMDTLPFFDDFSYATKSPYPTKNHWLDSMVYINTGFAIAPPSIGVATFDGLNKKGKPYNVLAPVGSSNRADTLTSRRINLEKKLNFTYSLQDSIYLSFYYQAEGRGDAPEFLDELRLEFFNPTQNIWKLIWSKTGYNPSATDTAFNLVTIPITDVQYLDSLFQFRFVNKATLSGSLDHWHIDYVYLNKDRKFSDPVLEDVAFGNMSTPFLKNYSSMPYRQFIPSEMSTTITNYMRNNSTLAKTKTYEFNIYPKTGGPSLYNYTGGTNPIYPFATNGWHNTPSDYQPTIAYTFPTLTDSTYFKIVHTVNSTPDYVRGNDTIIQIQKLKNYYAYDDGTAEQGYYLNTIGAKTAVRYTLNVADTLKALNIYFDPIVDGAAIVNSSFRVMVWADGGGSPSNTVICRDSLVYPRYIANGYNIIPSYSLTSCLLLNPGTYYFGIQQTTNKGLNLGFDRNTDHKDALYYDIGNGWAQSTTPGSLMINPVIGCYEPPVIIGLKNNEGSLQFKLYPNPAQNQLNIINSNTFNATVTIVNAIGQVVLTQSDSNTAIDISNLNNGLYFVYLQNNNFKSVPQKLIISK